VGKRRAACGLRHVVCDHAGINSEKGQLIRN